MFYLCIQNQPFVKEAGRHPQILDQQRVLWVLLASNIGQIRRCRGSPLGVLDFRKLQRKLFCRTILHLHTP
jgi:hypothetical protein